MENFKKFIKFFRIFLIFYVIVSFGFILYFAGKNFFEVIFYLNYYVFLGFLLWILFLILDSFRVLILSKGLNKNLSFKNALEFLVSGSFFALTTPFGSGGLPYQIWLLNKFNFSISDTLTLIISRGLCIFIPYLLFLPFVINYVKTNISKIFLVYAFLVVIIFFIVFVFKRDYREKLKNLNFKFLALSILISFPIQILYLSFLYISIKSFSIEINYFSAFFKQIIMQLSTYFQITPGGLGISEIISSLIISENVDFKYIGFIIVIWRFFTSYLNGFIGFYFVMKRIK